MSNSFPKNLEELPDGVYTAEIFEYYKTLSPKGIAIYTFEISIPLNKNGYESPGSVTITRTFSDNNLNQLLIFLHEIDIVEPDGYIDWQILDYFLPLIVCLKTKRDGTQDIAAIYPGKYPGVE